VDRAHPELGTPAWRITEPSTPAEPAASEEGQQPPLRVINTSLAVERWNR